MKRKKKLVTCWQCGADVSGLAAVSSGPTPLINYAPAAKLPMSQREIEAVRIPFQHALHIAAPLGFSVCILCVLSDISQARSLGWGWIVGSAVFVAVRVVAAVGDWEQFGWRLEQLFKVDLNKDGTVGEPGPQQPRQTAIDEVDERFPNGAPRSASLTWLPISPEETQRLAVALVVEDVLFVRSELVRKKALRHNDYTAIKDVLLEKRYLRKVGNGLAVTMAGYRWFCKKIPQTMTPLPYTSLRIGRL